MHTHTHTFTFTHTFTRTHIHSHIHTRTRTRTHTHTHTHTYAHTFVFCWSLLFWFFWLFVQRGDIVGGPFFFPQGCFGGYLGDIRLEDVFDFGTGLLFRDGDHAFLRREIGEFLLSRVKSFFTGILAERGQIRHVHAGAHFHGCLSSRLSVPARVERQCNARSDMGAHVVVDRYVNVYTQLKRGARLALGSDGYFVSAFRFCVCKGFFLWLFVLLFFPSLFVVECEGRGARDVD